MHPILLALNEKSASIQASAIISTDGLVLASVLPNDMDEDTMGAICAGLYSLGSRSAKEFAGGMIEQIIVRYANGYLLMVHAGRELVLTVITKTHTELDLIFLALKRAVEKIMIHLNSQIEMTKRNPPYTTKMFIDP